MAMFSERQGISPPPSLQIDSVLPPLRNSIWNLVLRLYDGGDRYWPRVARQVASELRKLPVDEVPLRYPAKWIKEYYFELPWHGVYDFCEFVVKNHAVMTVERSSGRHIEVKHRLTSKAVADAFNGVFEREMSGYRFVNWEIVPISNSSEVGAIEGAIEKSITSGLRGAATHLASAVEALGQKPVPDYRGCIREAIHAVESVAVQIDGGASETLDPALKALSKKADIHPALQGAFGKMYGYTNDSDGIRHAIIDEPKVDFADAKYMLVSCSAFVHYLIEKANAAGLLAK